MPHSLVPVAGLVFCSKSRLCGMDFDLDLDLDPDLNLGHPNRTMLLHGARLFGFCRILVQIHVEVQVWVQDRA